MKRRHRVNRELLLPTQGRPQRRGLKAGLAVAAALGLTGALTIPIVAQGVEDRQGNIPVAIDTINDPSFFTGDVYVDEHAPLAIFGATGKQVAIDGRPVGMLEGADETAENESTLLAGQVGQLGVLPGDLQLMHPVTTRRITSSYGWRKNPTGPGNQIHIGQDYGLACGSPVYAAESGRVIVSGWHGHSGNRVTVDHGNNVHTGYSHNSKLLVKIGDEVEQGELIALVGTTGNSTGCHLHFEVIIDGRWHDPRNYLPSISGQPNPMVDSRRLTVKSYTAPEGRPNTGNSPQPSEDPDVVVPKDDTPVVPSPTPTTKPSPSSPTPTPSEQTPQEPSPSTDPNTPSPSEPEPSEEESSPSPSDEATAEPTAPETSHEPEGPPPHSGTPTESASPSKDASESESASPTGSQEPENLPSPPSSQTPQNRLSPSPEPASTPSATALKSERSTAPSGAVTPPRLSATLSPSKS